MGWGLAGNTETPRKNEKKNLENSFNSTITKN